MSVCVCVCARAGVKVQINNSLFPFYNSSRKKGAPMYNYSSSCTSFFFFILFDKKKSVLAFFSFLVGRTDHSKKAPKQRMKCRFPGETLLLILFSFLFFPPFSFFFVCFFSPSFSAHCKLHLKPNQPKTLCFLFFFLEHPKEKAATRQSLMMRKKKTTRKKKKEGTLETNAIGSSLCRVHE